MPNLIVYSDNTVSLNGRMVGRVDRNSFQMKTGVRGKTVFFTGKPGTYDQPHEMDVPLYVPAVEGSVSEWKVNPEFAARVADLVSDARIDLNARFEHAVAADLHIPTDGSGRHADLIDFIWDGDMEFVESSDGYAWRYPSGTVDVSGTFEHVVHSVAERYRDTTGWSL